MEEHKFAKGEIQLVVMVTLMVTLMYNHQHISIIYQYNRLCMSYPIYIRPLRGFN